MKLISWNVNGLRACVGKGDFDTALKALDADIFCIQETKLQAGQIELELPGYTQYWNYALRKGYSGTAMYTKATPIDVTYGIGIEAHDTEGRVITARFNDFYLVCVYTPNSGDGLNRLAYRMEWERDFLAYVQGLEQTLPVIVCGDLNVAHEEIDIKNPSSNRHSAGFTDEERSCMDTFLEAGYIDTYRYFHPDEADAYSWWSYRFHARERNAGWRIDYFLVSCALKPRLVSASIHSELYGSDHCPVELVIS